jgi:hypothetical protein
MVEDPMVDDPIVDDSMVGDPVAGTSAMFAFGLSDIEVGNFVMVHGAYLQQEQAVEARKLHRKKPDHPAQVHVVGPVTAIDSENNLLQIAGVKVDISGFSDLMVDIGDKASASGSYDEESMTLMPSELEIEPKE